MTETPAPLRIPIAHSVRYAARGLPDVPFLYGPGVIRPSEITLTYRAAPDSQLGQVHAYVKGRLWVDEREVPTASGYGQHYDDGLGGWPKWLTEEARLHDPAAVPPATDRAALRQQVAEAVERVFEAWREGLGDQRPQDAITNEVLSVLPASSDRAAALREAADFFRGLHATKTAISAAEAEAELRRMADETPQAETQAERRETVEFLTQTQQPDGTWEFSSGATRVLEAAASIQASLRRRFPDTGHRLAQRTTTVVVQLLADCPACGAGIEHDVHCPTPETHNWGCGCPPDQAQPAKEA